MKVQLIVAIALATLVQTSHGQDNSVRRTLDKTIVVTPHGTHTLPAPYGAGTRVITITPNHGTSTRHPVLPNHDKGRARNDACNRYSRPCGQAYGSDR